MSLGTLGYPSSEGACEKIAAIHSHAKWESMYRLVKASIVSCLVSEGWIPRARE